MMTTTDSILLVDDDETFGAVMQRALSRRNISSEFVTSSQAAIKACEAKIYSRAIVDLKIAQDSGLTLIKSLRTINPNIHIVILTGYSSISTAVEAIKLGAVNYLCKPIDIDQILQCFSETESTQAISPPAVPPSLDRMEWELIQKALLTNNGNISATARELGMHRRTLQRKLMKRPAST